MVVCLSVIVLFVLLGQYAHPSSDDLCMANGVEEYGLFTQLLDHYFGWSGRYTGNFLYALYPVIVDLFDGYKLIPGMVILLLFFAAAFFISSAFRVRITAWPVLLASLCFVCIFLLGMLSPASGLYWMAGAFTYQSANILFLVILGLMIQLSDRQKESKKTSALSLLLPVLMVLAIGTNETSMLALTAVVFVGVMVHLRLPWVMLMPWLVLLIVTLICFAIVYLSPGNQVRAADFPMRHDLVRSIGGSLSVGGRMLWLWISDPVFVISIMLAPFSVSVLVQSSGRQWSVASSGISRTKIAMLLCCTFIMPVLLQFPAWWSMGGWPPARTSDAIYFLFLLGVYLTVGACTMYYLDKTKYRPLQQSYSTAVVVLLAASVVFSFVVLQSASFKQAKTDLLQLAGPYHEYMEKRYRHIEQAKADGHLKLIVARYLQEYPRTIYFNDITSDADDWRNVCYAEYFGLEKIKRK